MSFRNSHANEESRDAQPLKKIPREARPDSCPTEALQQFLRDISPPAKAFSSDPQRLSGGSSRNSRGKSLFKNLLRSNPPQRVLLNTNSHVSGGPQFSHNCIVLRQVVPGQNQQYYRIVRDSSQFDSLETKSTFRVNYQFPRHDVDQTSSHKDPVEKSNMDQRSGQTKGSHLHSTSTRLKPRFHLRARKVIDNSSKQPPPSQEKSTCSHTDEERRGRSSKRSEPMIDEKVLGSLRRETIQPQTIADNTNLQTPKAMLQNNHVEDAPQLGDFTAGTVFPASDLIKSWGRRRSIKSVDSSPGRIQSIQSKKFYSPKASKSPRNIRNARSALPMSALQNPTSMSPIENRPMPTIHSPTKHSRQLASPVKLSGQKRLRQKVLDRPRPLMKDLGALALTSNPSRSFDFTSLESSRRTDAPIISRASITAKNDVAEGNSNIQRTSASGFSINRESVLNAIGSSTPVKKIASVSVELGSPTTPPPRTPLPPVPRTSQAKSPNFSNHVYQPDASEERRNTLAYTIQNLPAKSPARIIQIMDLRKQQEELLQSTNSERVLVDNIQNCNPECQENPLALQNSSNSRTPDVASLEWPQTPNTNPEPDESQSAIRFSTVWQKQNDDHFRNRAERTNSLKRRHLQNTHEQTRSMRGSREGSNTSRVPLTPVMELSAQQDLFPEPSMITMSSTLQNDSSPGVTTTCSGGTSSKKKIPTLTFSGVKTEAVIKPLSVLDHKKPHHRMPGRTVYRSHSTQMTPGKHHDARFDSGGSSASNDESVIIHHRQQGHQENLSDSIVSSSTTKNEKPEEIVENTVQSGCLDEVVLDRIDRILSSMEDRLYKKLSEEMANQFVRLEEKTVRVKGVEIGLRG